MDVTRTHEVCVPFFWAIRPAQCVKPIHCVRAPDSLSFVLAPGREMSRRYKYLLVLEGNDIATSLKWALSSDSLVVMPTPTTESWFLEGTLKPYVHYVPLERPEDASKVLHWLRAHDRQVRHIITNANAFAKRFRGGARRCSRATTIPMDCVIKPSWARVLLNHAASAWHALKEIVDRGGDGDG